MKKADEKAESKKDTKDPKNSKDPPKDPKDQKDIKDLKDPKNTKKDATPAEQKPIPKPTIPKASPFPIERIPADWDPRIPLELWETIQIPAERHPFKAENIWETEICDFFEDCNECMLF